MAGEIDPRNNSKATTLPEWAIKKLLDHSAGLVIRDGTLSLLYDKEKSFTLFSLFSGKLLQLVWKTFW